MHQIICDDWYFHEDCILEILKALKDRKDVWKDLTETREDSGNNPGKRTLLASAIHYGRFQVARKLLEFDPSLINLNDREDNVLHVLCEGSIDRALEFLEFFLPDNLELLNQVNLDGNIPLHISFIRGRKQLLTRLFQEPSLNICAQDSNGNNVLHLFYTFIRPPTKDLRLKPEDLKVYDADTLRTLVNTKNLDGKTCSMLAITAKELDLSFFDDWKDYIDLSIKSTSNTTLFSEAVTLALDNVKITEYMDLLKKLLTFCQCTDLNLCCTMQELDDQRIPLNLVLEKFKKPPDVKVQLYRDYEREKEVFIALLSHQASRNAQVLKALEYGDCIFHDIIKDCNISREIFDHLIKNFDNDNEDLVKVLAMEDGERNTLFHVAGQDPITEENLMIMHTLLILGVDPCVQNNDGQIFLQMSANLKLQLIHFYDNVLEDFEDYKDLKVLKSLIQLGDDELLCCILSKLTKMQVSFHPVQLIGLLYPKRDTLPSSYLIPLKWEGFYHNQKVDMLKRCCYDYFDQNEALDIYSKISENIQKPLELSYYTTKAFQSFFIVSFLLKLFDFATDMALNFEYFSASSKIIKDFPPAEACTNETMIACYFHDTPENLFFIISMTIFALTFIFDITLILMNSASQHYLAIIAGHCCWNQVTLTNLINWLIWILIVPINSALMYLYDFWIKTFSEYWLNNTKEVPKTDCNVKGCDTCDCICIYCGRNSKEKSKLSSLSENSFKLCYLAKIVTFSSENALMPLLQLSILLPNVLYLFPKEDIVITEDYESVLNHVKTNWRFIVTSISIFTSLFSMGYALTEIYFSKKERQKTFGRWIFYFLSIIFQIIPKILAYQVFAFGFWTYFFGHHYVIAYIFILPVFFVFVRMIGFFFATKKFYLLNSLAFAMSTIYTFNSFALKLVYQSRRDEIENEDPEAQRLEWASFSKLLNPLKTVEP